MPKHNDEALVAYLDGELDDAERQHVEAWLAADPAVRERLEAIGQSAESARSAYADILEEPVPERLLAAARGVASADKSVRQDAEILMLRPRIANSAWMNRRRLGTVAAAAGLFGIVLGGAGTYVGIDVLSPSRPTTQQQLASEESNTWLENAAGYYKLSVNAGDNLLIDVPANNQTSAALQKISQSPQQVRLPDLKPWGLSFRGARLVVVEGRPAAELIYVTDNKAIGPLTLVIGTTKLPDIAPTADQREGVNLLYWRHHGRAYTLVGRTDVSGMWGIANDIAWQLDAV